MWEALHDAYARLGLGEAVVDGWGLGADNRARLTEPISTTSWVKQAEVSQHAEFRTPPAPSPSPTIG